MNPQKNITQHPVSGPRPLTKASPPLSDPFFSSAIPYEPDFMTKPKDTHAKSLDVPGWAEIWPLDWYVFDEFGLQGPLTSKQAFSLAPMTLSGQTRFVSRKGFTQWYPLEDLSGLYAAATLWEEKLLEAAALTSKHASKMSTVTTNHISGVPQLSPTIYNHQADLSPLLARESTIEKMATQISNSKNDSSTIASPTPALPQVHNPLGVLALMIMTCGLSWFSWARRLSRSLRDHTGLNAQLSLHRELDSTWITWASLIPGGHFVILADMVDLLRAAELEHELHRGTSKALTMMLGIFPPCAAMYLTMCANRHARLHQEQFD